MFNSGQVVYFTKNTTAAMTGALAIVNEDQRDGRFLYVTWLRNHRVARQMDGGYSISDFRLATRNEVQDARNEAEKLLKAMNQALLSIPKFEVGDFVYHDNGTHRANPFKVLSIHGGKAFCYRPNGGGSREDATTGTSTWNIQELITRPSLDHTINKAKYE